MNITSLGHAGLKVQTRHATLLCDPWFSPEGAFQGSWFPYPDNSHLCTPDLASPAAIVISHEHFDHVDPWFLARVPPSVPVVIPRYPAAALRDKVLSAGPRRIIEAPEWEPVDVAPGARVFFISEPPMNHDSAIVVQADGHTLLNMNDARLFPMQLREIRRRAGGVIDAFAFQAAGASWFPMCYGYAVERRAELSLRKRLAKFAYTARCARLLDPVIALPFAGPPCFLDPALFEHNREMERGIFPDQHQAVEWLSARGIPSAILLPGDAWDAQSRTRDPDPLWRDFSYADRWPYLQSYAQRRRAAVQRVLARYPAPDSSLWELFADYGARLLALSPYYNRKINMRVGFDIRGAAGGRWAVDFRPGHEGVSRDMGRCGYSFRFDDRWLPSLLAGTTRWEDFFLSLRFEAARDPDVYNDHLFGLLKFAAPAALEAVETFEAGLGSDETITIEAEGHTYRVSRFCPHAGNDLLDTGQILPGGILTCLAHHYEFDLGTGRALNGDCPALGVERLR